MAKHIEVKTMQEAWNMVDQIFPTDYEEDPQSRERAGYPVYRSTVEYYDYICDLNDRLEINLKDGRTINIWVVADEEPKTPDLPDKEDVKKAAANQYTFEPEMVQLVSVVTSGYKFESEASRRVYEAMRKVENDRFWLFRIGGDMVEAYCDDKGIEWGSIRVIAVTHYGKEYGHFVIEAIVTPRVKE